MGVEIEICPFTERHASDVRALFIMINRLLSPPTMRAAFDSYIARSLVEEIDRIGPYYAERNGGFWVALAEGRLAGMVGLEQVAPDTMELRRMYVDPSAQRRGVARQMLRFAKMECRRRDMRTLCLSTSELQQAALALYRGAGYGLTREETAVDASNKTVGAGIHRYYFEKRL